MWQLTTADWTTQALIHTPDHTGRNTHTHTEMAPRGQAAAAAIWVVAGGGWSLMFDGH